jgi:hypothetical protein
MQNKQGMQEETRIQYNLQYVPALAVIVIKMLASSTGQLLLLKTEYKLRQIEFSVFKTEEQVATYIDSISLC